MPSNLRRCFAFDEASAASLCTRAGALVSLCTSRFGAAREHLEASGENVSLQVSDWSNAPRVELRVGRQTTAWNTDDAATLQLEAFARLLQIGEPAENRSTFGEAIAVLELK